MDSRFSQYQQQQQPARSTYSQPSLPQAMHSTYQSSASLSSLASVSTSPSQTNMHSRQSPVLSSAPLPSPDGQRQPQDGNYFGAMMPAPAMQQPEQSFGLQMQSHSFFQQPQQQQQQLQQPQQQMQFQQHEQHAFGQHQGQRGSSGGMPETAPYLQGFNLLAEAAKRAEMACLLRDLDDFEM